LKNTYHKPTFKKFGEPGLQETIQEKQLTRRTLPALILLDTNINSKKIAIAIMTLIYNVFPPDS